MTPVVLPVPRPCRSWPRPVHLRAALLAVLVVVVTVTFPARPARADGAGYGGDAGKLVVELVRHDGEQAAGPELGAGAAVEQVSVRVSGGGWLGASALQVDVPGEPRAVAVSDGTGHFRTVVPVSGAGAPSGFVRVRGPGPDLLPRELVGAVPTPGAGLDPRILLLGAGALALVLSVVGPALRRRLAGRSGRTVALVSVAPGASA